MPGTNDAVAQDARVPARARRRLGIALPWPERLRLSQPQGLRLAGGRVMLRKLMFFSADLTRARWYRQGSGPPRPAPPDDVRLEWLSPEAWRAAPDALTTPAALAAARFAAGASCLVGRAEPAGRVVYHLWVTQAPTYLPWIFRRIAPPAGHVLVCDVWVDPARRGRGVHWTGASLACEEAVRRGRPGIFAGVEEHEYFLFARKYARIGFGWPVPVGAIIGLKVGPLRIHVPARLSPAVVGFSDELAARYPHAAELGREAGPAPGAGR